ncbi:MAG: glucose 1-dehydrogenase [Desulfitobacterium hafniense]|nr:glucose 1-dehydrogenase [Desulfitobacterium hafniense]
MNFLDKVVVVTGAANGLGKGIALEYSANLAKLVIADKDSENGERLVQEINSNGREGLFVNTDVNNPDDIVRLFQKVVESFGVIDILVNNAGVSRINSPYDLAVDEWDYVLNTNLRGIFLCSREAAKVMKDHGGGSIVNISSTRAFMSEPNTEAYAASKGGIIALTHAMAISFSSDNIQVNCISPGWIETGDYDSLREIDHLQHPSGRVGKPIDIAKACLFLSNPGNDFMTGTNIVIDGGMTRKMIYEP